MVGEIATANPRDYMSIAPMPPVGQLKSTSDLLLGDPAKQTQLHCNPFTGKTGDRVRVTFEATVGYESKNVSEAMLIKLSDNFAGMTIELIERPVKPLAVGDRVTSIDASRIHDGQILCILNDQAWVKEHDGLATTVMLRDLRRA